MWVFPNEDSDPINEALSAIARQLSLWFNIANQGPAFRRGEGVEVYTVSQKIFCEYVVRVSGSFEKEFLIIMSVIIKKSLNL